MIPKCKQNVKKSGDTMTGPLVIENKNTFTGVDKTRTVNGVDYTVRLGVGADGSASLELHTGPDTLGRIDITPEGTIKNWKTGRKLIEEDEIYYKSGDTISADYGIYVGGTLTGGAKQIVFSMTTDKSLKNINKITLNSMKLTVRSVTGEYLLNGVNNTDFDGTVSIERRNNNTLSIYWNANTAFSATNNTPVAVAINNFNISLS